MALLDDLLIDDEGFTVGLGEDLSLTYSIDFEGETYTNKMPIKLAQMYCKEMLIITEGEILSYKPRKIVEMVVAHHIKLS